MQPVFAFQKLDVYVAARELMQRVHAGSLADAELRDQATRAAKSVFLNVSEGLPDHRPGVRRKHFTIARNSLGELVAAIDLAVAIDAMPIAQAEAALALAGRVRPMVYGLLRNLG